jgi:hypothetical protein
MYAGKSPAVFMKGFEINNNTIKKRLYRPYGLFDG